MVTKIGVGTVMILVFLFVYTGIRSDTARQAACEISDSYSVITMKSAVPFSSGSVQFDTNGELMRFWPGAYAVDYEETDIVMKYPRAGAVEGKLKLEIDGPWGIKTTKPIGWVRRDCWEKVQKFLRSVVRRAGHAARVSEAVGPSWFDPLLVLD